MTIDAFFENHPVLMGSILGASCSVVFAITWMLLDLIFGGRRP